MAILFFRCALIYLLFFCFCTSDLSRSKEKAKGKAEYPQSSLVDQSPSSGVDKNTPFFLDVHQNMSEITFYTMLDGYSKEYNSNIEKLMEFSNGSKPHEVYCYKIFLENDKRFIADIIPHLGSGKVFGVQLSVHNAAHSPEDINILLQDYMKKYGVPKFHNQCQSKAIPAIKAFEYGWETKDRVVVFTYSSDLNKDDFRIESLKIEYFPPDPKIIHGDPKSFNAWNCLVKENMYLQEKGIPTKQNIEKTKDDL